MPATQPVDPIQISITNNTGIQRIEYFVRRLLAELAPGMEIQVRVSAREPHTTNLYIAYDVELWTGEGRSQSSVDFSLINMRDLTAPEVGGLYDYLRMQVQSALRDLRAYREPIYRREYMGAPVYGTSGLLGYSMGQVEYTKRVPDPASWASQWVPDAYMDAVRIGRELDITAPKLPAAPMLRVSRFERILAA